MKTVALLLICVTAASAQQPAPIPAPTVALVPVRPIEPPPTPLSPEAVSAGITRFSFVAYGDTRCNCYTPIFAPYNGRSRIDLTDTVQ